MFHALSLFGNNPLRDSRLLACICGERSERHIKTDFSRLHSLLTPIEDICT